MLIKKRVVASFISYIMFTILAVYNKIINDSHPQNFLLMAIVSWLVFTVFALWEINTSKRIYRTEKRRWTFRLIFFGGFGGILYFFFGRKRMA